MLALLRRADGVAQPPLWQQTQYGVMNDPAPLLTDRAAYIGYLEARCAHVAPPWRRLGSCLWLPWLGAMGRAACQIRSLMR